MSALEKIRTRLSSYGIDLDSYKRKGTEFFDMGHTGRGINFVADRAQLLDLREKLYNAQSPSGGRAFANAVEDWSNAALKASFTFTKGQGFRELRNPRDASFDQQIYPEDRRGRPDFQANPVFSNKNSAIDGGSLHVALDSSYCNMHFDESICFVTGEAVLSPDSVQHTGNELGLRDKGMFGDVEHWDKLPYRKLNYSAIATGAYLGLYVGNGVLGHAVRGHGGTTLGAAVAPVVMGLAGWAAGRWLPGSTLSVMDHFSLVMPSSGSNYSSHFGLRFQVKLDEVGPFQNVGLTANMFYKPRVDGGIMSAGWDDIHIGKDWSVSMHGEW